jgi:hypothetical protein
MAKIKSKLIWPLARIDINKFSLKYYKIIVV